MEYILADALEIFDRHSGWIVWNLFLAFIPLALSFWLFRRRRTGRSLLWWLLFIVFVAFLPNAPYLLTDIIHLIKAIRDGYSAWIITLIFIPLHLFAILSGFEAYVISVMNLSHYLRRQGVKQFVLPAELMTHALSALGIYLGRFQRFNSWDLVTEPDEVLIGVMNNLTDRRPLLVIIITFIVITVSYWLMKQVTLGIVLRIREVWAGRNTLE
jgi:uncharacterized membrane protein